MLSTPSCENIAFKSVAQSLIALFVDSVEQHNEKMPNADNSTQCAFSISWKIVKVFSVNMKKVQNAFKVKQTKIVPATGRKNVLMAQLWNPLPLLRLKRNEHRELLGMCAYWRDCTRACIQSVPGKTKLFRSRAFPSTSTYFIRPNPHPLEGLPKAALNSAENDSFISEIISNTSS